MLASEMRLLLSYDEGIQIYHHPESIYPLKCTRMREW